MQILDPILYMIIGGCVGGLLGWFLARDQVRQYLDDLREETEDRARKRAARRVKEEMSDDIRRELIDEYREEAQAAADSEAQEIVATAERDAEAALKEAALEAKAVVADARVTADEELKERRQELQKVEERLGRRESNLDRRALRLDERESELKDRRQKVADEQEQVRAKKEEWNQRCQDVTARLEAISGYDAARAKKELKERMIGAAEAEAQEQIKTIEQQAHDDAEKEARKILSIACQRYAGDFVAEKSVRVIDLPSDNMKGRIIGREGRNIRALEQATGVDIIIDDTPEVVVVSCFDPVRREIARRALEKLIADGRIHPTHIEEMVAKADQEVAQAIQEAGNEAVLELGIHGLHPELLELVGQLKFRTSYGQNIWAHSIEVGFLCGLMAAELGVDVARARRAGLLHDIGKAVSHERDEGHAIVGAKLAARHGEEEVVRNAIAAHHNEEPQQSVIAHLVIAADALSGARPGARREVLGAYVKRLEALERIATDFEGVQKAYAIQAGREVRVIVAQDTVDDEGAKKLSKEIAKRIESELTYPGQIVVTVIRETRAQGYAR